MTSAALLEAMTTQLGELEPRHVLQLRARVARLAAMLEREDPVYRSRLAAGLAASGRTAAAAAVIARGEDPGQ